MNRVVVVLILVLLPLLSCFGPHNYTYNVQVQDHIVKIAPIYIDAAWDDNERTAIKQAIQEWNVVLNNEMRLTIKDDHYKMDPQVYQSKWPTASDPGYMLIKISKRAPIIKQEEIYIAYGFTNYMGGNRIYFVRDRLIWDNELKKERSWDMIDLSNITRHELGHALGSNHISYNGLMMYYYDKKLFGCIDATAVFTVASYQHLSTTGLKYCVH